MIEPPFDVHPWNDDPRDGSAWVDADEAIKYFKNFEVLCKRILIFTHMG